MMCSISGIRLQTSCLTLIRNIRVSTFLLSQWLLYSGPVFFDGTDLTEEETTMLASCLIIEIPEKNIAVCKSSFLRKQFNDIFGHIVNGYFDYNTTALMYCKILLGFAFLHDPITAIEHLMMLYWSCTLFLKDPSLELPQEDSIGNIIDLSDLLHAVTLCTTCSDNECVMSTLNLHAKWPPSVTNNMFQPI